MKAVKKSNLHQTNVNVKGHIAKTKSGTATYVDPHQRKDMVADKPTDKNGSQGSNVSNEHLTKLGIDINNTTIKSTFNDHLTNGEIIAMADIGDKPGERGLTENMKRLAIKGSDGTVKDGFFKSLFNDPFIYSNAFLRSNNNGEGGHITLNDNDNNPLSKDEHKIIEKKLTDNNVSFDEKKKILDSHKG